MGIELFHVVMPQERFITPLPHDCERREGKKHTDELTIIHFIF
jgi:hypothetical protein